MSLRQIVATSKSAIARIPKIYLVVGVVVFAVILYCLAFRERTITFSYAGENCHKQAVLLPELTKQTGSGRYEVSTHGGFSVGDYKVMSTTICVTPREAPKEGSSEVVSLSPGGGPIARLSYKIETPALPQADTAAFEEPIAVSRPLSMKLSEADKTFSYHVRADDGVAGCEAHSDSLSCDIPELGLKQGAKYDLSLERQFKGRPVDVVIDADIETLSPVTVLESSIKAGATVYDKPSSLTIKADKPVKAAEFTLKKLGDKAEDVAIKSRIEGKQVVVSWPDDLPRETKFELVANTFEAEDGSVPLDKYELPFNTSGGPRVEAINIGTSSVALNAQATLTFDQELEPNQDITKLVSVEGVSALVSHSGKQVVIQLQDTPKCQDFTIQVDKKLLSKHGIPSSSSWQRTQRTICHSIGTAGYSSEGRPITTYEFGNGQRTILFVGAIHGNEASTHSLMQRWISELEARAREIPDDKRIVVVPAINPDGLARGSRVNARNVDLNRNFDTSDWQKDITTVGNKPFKGGGGKAAMSEPEVKAMAALASRLRPELTLSYHSIGGLLAANQAGRSNALANTYSSLSGYRNTTGQTSETFEYAISGTWDDYLAKRLGLASILVELGSHSYHQFERNQAAMWAMVKS